MEASLEGFSENVQDILESCTFRDPIPTLSRSDSLGTLISKCLDSCQKVFDAMEPYQRDREPLFTFIRCLVAGDRRILDEKPRANIPNIAEIKRDAALNRFADPLFLDQTEFHKPFKDNAPFRAFVREGVKRRINKTSP